MSPNPSIFLYTAQSPNGHKVSITLEELGLSYDVRCLVLSKLEQRESWFLDINPNGRIPALTDTLEDGTKINIFESGSIQQYLVDKYDVEHRISYPKGTREYIETNNWVRYIFPLFFQNAGVGPMQGQANHFKHYSHASEPIPYAIDRYINETRRLYRTVDVHLKTTRFDYLVGKKSTIADIALWCWVNSASFTGIDTAEFPVLQAWHQRMAQRPGVAKGYRVPEVPDLNQLVKDPAKFETFLNGNRSWITQGLKDDSRK